MHKKFYQTSMLLFAIGTMQCFHIMTSHAMTTYEEDPRISLAHQLNTCPDCKPSGEGLATKTKAPPWSVKRCKSCQPLVLALSHANSETARETLLESCKEWSRRAQAAYKKEQEALQEQRIRR